jgi:hypothetical protein
MILLFIGLLFWPFIMNEIITPTSLVIWLLLRMFVLSIGQQYYWGAIILVVFLFLIRILPQSQNSIQSDDYLDSNATIKSIGYWRSIFTLTDSAIRDEKIVKRELMRLLLSLYATKQRTSANFGLYEAIQQGEIPIPERIHLFLFPIEPEKPKRTLRALSQSIRGSVQKWFRHWNGQETAENTIMIDEVLSFMETSLEMKNDNTGSSTNKY